MVSFFVKPTSLGMILREADKFWNENSSTGTSFGVKFNRRAGDGDQTEFHIVPKETFWRAGCIAGDQNFGQAERLWNDWLSGKTPLELFSTKQKCLWNENS